MIWQQNTIYKSKLHIDPGVVILHFEFKSECHVTLIYLKCNTKAVKTEKYV